MQTFVDFTNALEWEKKILLAPNLDVNKPLISPYAGYPSPSSNSYLNFVIYYFAKQLNVSQSSPLSAQVSPALPTVSLVVALAHPGILFYVTKSAENRPSEKKIKVSFSVTQLTQLTKASHTSTKTSTRKQ